MSLVEHRWRVLGEFEFEPRQRTPRATDQIELLARQSVTGPAGRPQHLADRALERLLAILAQRRQAEHAAREGRAAADPTIRHFGQFEAAAAQIARDAARVGDRRNPAMPGAYGLLPARQPPDFESGSGPPAP